MADRRTLPGVLAVVLAAVLGWAVMTAAGDRAAAGPVAWQADGARFRIDAAGAAAAGVAVIPPPGPLRFAAGTADGDREAVLEAVASARPEVRALVARIGRLTRVSVGPTGPGVAGVTRTRPDGWEVELDLGRTSSRFGARGTARLVLHELAHVIDHALVTRDLEQVLDAATPAGVACTDAGLGGACAAREERFAESFAKWAVGDIGLNLDFGYRVPPPDLATWGRPLAVLVA